MRTATTAIPQPSSTRSSPTRSGLGPTAVPALGGVTRELAHAQAGWVALAVIAELASGFAFVVFFEHVFWWRASTASTVASARGSPRCSVRRRPGSARANWSCASPAGGCRVPSAIGRSTSRPCGWRPVRSAPCCHSPRSRWAGCAIGLVAAVVSDHSLAAALAAGGIVAAAGIVALTRYRSAAWSRSGRAPITADDTLPS